MSESKARPPYALPRDVSVVIPVRDVKETLGDQLTALRAQRGNHGISEVIVVDNGSDDGTAEAVQEWCRRWPVVRYLRAVERSGANHARNVGARAASGELLLYCDGDDIVDERWAEEMRIGATFGEIVGGYLEVATLNGERARALRGVKGRAGWSANYDPAPFAFSANVGIWAAVLRAMGGWNEDFVRGAEDSELCARAVSLGARVVVRDSAVVHYRLRSEAALLCRQMYWYAYQNARLYGLYPWSVRHKRVGGMAQSFASLMWNLPVNGSWEARAHWLRQTARTVGYGVGSLSRLLRRPRRHGPEVLAGRVDVARVMDAMPKADGATLGDAVDFAGATPRLANEAPPTPA